MSDFSIFAHDVDDLSALKTLLQGHHVAIRTAIMELAGGERVSTVTVSGKTTQFTPADLPQLRALKTEILDEMRDLFGIGVNLCFRVKTSKGL